MGDQLSCCNAKTQFENSLGSGQIFTPTNTTHHSLNNHLPNVNFPPISPRLKQLVQRAQKFKYFKAKNRSLTRPKQTVIYGTGHQSALYQGQTLNNTAEGYGTVIFQNGSFFEGLFSQGEPMNGIFVFNQSCYYVGDIQQFQASGQGIYENIQNGYYYEGQWKKNLQHGQGVQKYSNRDQYNGGFMCGSKFGQGQYKFADGKVYNGSFYNGHSDGVGKLTLPNGDSYEGQWKLGRMHGKGLYKWKNGEKYQGQYVNGLRQNRGKYFYANGAQYDGQWFNGLQEGQGTIKQGYDEVSGRWQGGEKIN